MGQEYTLWMPTISNTIRQMDQSAPGLDRAKSSWSRDHWISVNPTERGRRFGCISPHASLSLPFEHVSLSLSLSLLNLSSSRCLSFTLLLHYSHGIFPPKRLTNKLDHKRMEILGLLPFIFHLSILFSDEKPRDRHSR